MAIILKELGLVVQYAYDEESGVGVWQMKPTQDIPGPCQHEIVLYSDGDIAIAHIAADGTRLEYLKDPENPINYEHAGHPTKQ